MLVLTRKQNQEILIGDNIKITVLKMKGNTVRLGIDAPREINVVRGELPRHDAVLESDDEADISQVAEFTVVFSNSDETQRAKVDVIPFQPNQANDSKPNEIENGSHPGRLPNQTRNDRSESLKSIQFRGKLPVQLQHNRLQEIVNQLTSNPESSNL